MSKRHDIDPAAARQTSGDASASAALSRLMDAEATADETAALCAAWQHDEPMRARWHEWQLIGDVMRSDELTGAPQRDRAMLQALRLRLASEPVPLAPAAWPPADLEAGTPAARSQARRWRAPVAAAAGVFAVAGVLMTMQWGLPPLTLSSEVQAMASDTRLPLEQAARQTGARATPTQRVALQSTPAPAAAAAAVRAADEMASAPQWMLRDVGLDRYVSAHRKMPLAAEMPGRAEPMVQLVRAEK